jgi:predicted RND superfamily exporter protein
VHIIAPVLVGVVWYFGLLALLGIPIDVFNAVVPTVILTIGLADMLHLLNAVGKGRTNDAGYDSRLALRRILPAISLTTATTAFAFASLALEGSEALQRLAFCGVAGASLLWLAIVTMGPSACRQVAPQAMNGESFGKRVFSRLFCSVQFALRSRGLVIAGGATVMLIGLFSLSWVPADFEFTENLPGGPVGEAFETAEREGLAMAPLFVSLPTAPRDDLRKAIAALYQGSAPDMATVSEAIAGRDILVLPLPVTAGLRASGILDLADDTRARLAQHSDAIIGGFPVLVSEAAIRIVERLQIIFFFAIAILATMFGVIFRSAWVSVCALFVNLLPLLAMQAAMAFSVGWVNMASVVAMIVASGIVVDDTVHLLWAIRRQKRRTTTQAVIAGLRESGEPVSLTSLALICGFSVSLASGLPGLQLFGALVMLSLCLAWLADMYLLPAILISRGDIE